MEPTTQGSGGNSTQNTVLIIILVIIVGLVVWYFTSHRRAAPAPQDNSAGLQINLTGGQTNSNANSSAPSGY